MFQLRGQPRPWCFADFDLGSLEKSDLPIPELKKNSFYLGIARISGQLGEKLKKKDQRQVPARGKWTNGSVITMGTGKPHWTRRSVAGSTSPSAFFIYLK